MKIIVLYEDSDTLVINKPVGVVVNRAESVEGETVQDWVEANNWFGLHGLENKLFRQRSGVCHRLDKETSGCLMIAKNPVALEFYLAQFKERRVKKHYLALVHGRVEPAEGEVRLPLKRSIFDREKWQVHYEGKRAVTAWSVEKRFVDHNMPRFRNALTLLTLDLKTGRTHQIRVHLSFLGWPVFADGKYLGKEVAERDRRLLGHQFLHASELKFENTQGEPIEVKADLPEDCLNLLAGLMLE